jgi:hypothetical protein
MVPRCHFIRPLSSDCQGVKRNVGIAISNINNLMDDKETILKMSMKELNK